MKQKLSCHEIIMGLEGAVVIQPTADAPGTWCIKDVKILGYESSKGRRYSEQAMEGACKLYENKPIYEDHDDPDPSLPPGSFRPRKVRESLGFVRNVRHVPGKGLIADAHFTVHDKLTESVMVAAAPGGNPTQYGFSPHHFYDGKKAPDGFFDVTVIEHVESVDLVTKPATTGGLYEGVDVVADTPKKLKSCRESLLAICRVPWERKLVQGLEDMADVPMPETTEASPEDQINAGFNAMVSAVLADSSLDTKGKMAKIKAVLQAQEKLLTGESTETEGAEDPTKPAAKEGEDTAKPDDKEKDKTKEGLAVVTAQGIGATEAVRLMNKHGVSIDNADFFESVQLLPAVHADRVLAQLADKEKQIADVKKLLPPPKSIARGSWMGATEGRDTVTKPGERKVPAWASVN